ncbi:MAG TPA: RidA family protein [Bacillota bacterium]|nr:RidA family protein [Bacillota bacterium]HPF42143.1 RidA family protein [Bacillota bacterium]HPJ85330.1 RidA family protein [Bacillota bacterium]HPQ61374.1 RidA family protein [Bacillota bacterium]
MNKPIFSDLAPKAIGPYSQAIDCGDFLFVSGQLPVDPVTGNMEKNDIKIQTKRSLDNVIAIANEAGYFKSDVVKCTVYLKNLNDFSQMNEVYQEFFSNHRPARVALEVARLPKDALVEIDAICHK